MKKGKFRVENDVFGNKKNVFFMIDGSKHIIYVKIARGDRIPLKTTIEQSSGDLGSRKHLTTLCNTRFIERQTAVVTLKALLHYVVQSLEEMKEWSSSEIRKTAMSLLFQFVRVIL